MILCISRGEMHRLEFDVYAIKNDMIKEQRKTP